MQLLDLPFEIFSEIINILVTDVGVHSAWKTRPVCKAFAEFVHDDVIANHPIKAFERRVVRKPWGTSTSFDPSARPRTSESRLFKETSASFIYRRTNLRRMDCDLALPMAIREVVHFLLRHNRVSGKFYREKQREVTMKLCEFVSKNRQYSAWAMLQEGISEGVTTTGNQQHVVPHLRWQERFMTDIMVVSTLTRNLKGFEFCLEHGTKLWNYSYPFGYTLTAAVVEEDPKRIEWVLERLPKEPEREEAEVPHIVEMFNNALFHSIAEEAFDSATQILKWFSAWYTLPSEELYNTWTARAISSENEMVVEATRKVQVEAAEVVSDAP